MKAIGSSAAVRLLRLGDPEKLRDEQRLQARGHEVHLLGRHRDEAPVLLPGLVVDLADLCRSRARPDFRTLRTMMSGDALAEPVGHARKALERLLLEREPVGQQVLGLVEPLPLDEAGVEAAGCTSSSGPAANRSRRRAAPPRRSASGWSARAGRSSCARGPRARRRRASRPATAGSSIDSKNPKKAAFSPWNVVVVAVEDRGDTADVLGRPAGRRRAASRRAGRTGSRPGRPWRRPSAGARRSSGRPRRCGRRRRRSARRSALLRPIRWMTTSAGGVGAQGRRGGVRRRRPARGRLLGRPSRRPRAPGRAVRGSAWPSATCGSGRGPAASPARGRS